MTDATRFLQRFNRPSKKQPAIDFNCDTCLEFRDAHVESRLSLGVWREWQIHVNRDHAKLSKARKALFGF